MNGNWKNDVGGWNRKDTKRKTQTFNNRIKDNIKIIFKVYNGWKRDLKIDKNIFRNETVLLRSIPTYEGRKIPLKNIAKVYKLKVYYHNTNDDLFSSKYNNNFIVDAYLDEYSPKHKWINTKTNNDIFENKCLDDLQIIRSKIMKISELEEIKIDNQKEIEKRKDLNISEDNYGEFFIYGKPFPEWKRYTLYNSSKHNNFKKKFTNSSNRRKIRDWINLKDWEKSF